MPTFKGAFSNGMHSKSRDTSLNRHTRSASSFLVFELERPRSFAPLPSCIGFRNLTTISKSYHSGDSQIYPLNFIKRHVTSLLCFLPLASNKIPHRRNKFYVAYPLMVWSRYTFHHSETHRDHPRAAYRRWTFLMCRIRMRMAYLVESAEWWDTTPKARR